MMIRVTAISHFLPCLYHPVRTKSKVEEINTTIPEGINDNYSKETSRNRETISPHHDSYQLLQTTN